jgi:hypothetical protein
MKIKWRRPDIISSVFVIVGIVLISLTVAFRVNPAEASVVNPAVLGTTLHYILLFTTMPAWIAGVLLSGMLYKSSYEFAVGLMFLCQVLLYHFLGKIVSFLVAVVWNRRWKSGKSP